MSRVGKKLIPINSAITFKKEGNTVTVSGKNGSLSASFLDFVSVEHTATDIAISVIDPDNKFQRANWGTARAIISNMVTGVETGFTKELELNGVGFKMELSGQNLTLYVGFSHTVKLIAPDAIKLTLVKNLLTGTSYDKQMLNNFFGNIHEMKPCDPYKHKGFKFPGRFYIKKVGKKGGKAK
jgi:large subunit ribosomal protein L6